MERLKITLVGMVLVLALVVAYGYGCGDGGEDSGGTDSVAAESDAGGGDGTAAAGDGEATTGAETGSSDGGDGQTDGGSGGDGSAGAADGGGGDGGGDSGDGDSGGGDSGDGGDGDSAGASGAPLTKPQFIKQGDAICEKVPTKYRAIVTEVEQEAQKNKKPAPSTAELNLKAAVPPLPEATEELEGLVPPQGDEQEAEAIIAALEAATKGLEEKPNSPLTGPQSPFDEFQKLTRKYGFKVCSQL